MGYIEKVKHNTLTIFYFKNGKVYKSDDFENDECIISDEKGHINGIYDSVETAELALNIGRDKMNEFIKKRIAEDRINEAIKMEELLTMPLAVCALIFNDKKEILSVSRKDNFNDIGLPGGKVDEGETLIEAIKRETEEELGKKIEVIDLVFQQMDSEYMVFTYLCTIIGEGKEISPKETGKIAYVSWDKLFDSNCTFADYNKNLFDNLKSKVNII